MARRVWGWKRRVAARRLEGLLRELRVQAAAEAHADLDHVLSKSQAQTHMHTDMRLTAASCLRGMGP